MPPTLQDIAKQTQTSVSTVSRVLSGGTSSQRISLGTRERVLAAAKSLGYRPNLIARSLRTRRSHTVALLLSDISNPFFGAIASLVEQSLHRHGYSLMLCNSGEDPEREIEYLKLLPQKGIDGLIVVPLMRTKKALMELLPANLPLVVLDRPIPGVQQTVCTNEEQSAGALCEVLQRFGVKRVALVAGPEHVTTHQRRAEIVKERFDVIASHRGPAQKETGRRAFIEFLEVQPEAIICTNNFLGQGLLDSIAEIHNPPIIACFDEIPMMHLLPLPIICSVQDIGQLAEGCVTQLLPQLKGEKSVPHAVVLDARVVTNKAFQKRAFKDSAE